MTDSNRDDPDLQGRYIGFGAAFGSGIGTALGVVLGTVFENLPVGIAIRTGSGHAIGVGIAESKKRDLDG